MKKVEQKQMDLPHDPDLLAQHLGGLLLHVELVTQVSDGLVPPLHGGGQGLEALPCRLQCRPHPLHGALCAILQSWQKILNAQHDMDNIKRLGNHQQSHTFMNLFVTGGGSAPIHPVIHP